MGIYIGMKKISEDDDTVSYSFDMIVVDKEYYKPNEFFPYKVESHRAFGYCTFNKKTEEFALDEKKTDPFFLTKKGNFFVVRVWGKLLTILESGEKFPEGTQYAA